MPEVSVEAAVAEDLMVAEEADFPVVVVREAVDLAVAAVAGHR